MYNVGGKIGPDVQYTADPQDPGVEDPGMYVCLDPLGGRYFVPGLTVEIGSDPKIDLGGEGTEVEKYHMMNYTAHMYICSMRVG